MRLVSGLCHVESCKQTFLKSTQYYLSQVCTFLMSCTRDIDIRYMPTAKDTWMAKTITSIVNCQA